MKEELYQKFHLFFKDVAVMVLGVIVFYLLFSHGLASENLTIAYISFLFMPYSLFGANQFSKKYEKHYEEGEEIKISEQDKASNYALLSIFGLTVLISLFNADIAIPSFLILMIVFGIHPYLDKLAGEGNGEVEDN